MLSTSLASEPPLHPSTPNDDQDLHTNDMMYGAVDDDINGGQSLLESNGGDPDHRSQHISFDAATSSRSRRPILYQHWQSVERAASQIPAIALVTLFHLMVAIPFGVSYFPVGWKSSSSAALSSEGDDVVSESDGGFILDGTFPLPGKEALGIRMFLFSTIIGQLALTYASNFDNCIALQMVENVPFCQSLTYIVVEIQGYGKEALSTLFFLFGLASVIVGLVFYFLGRMELGKILYFFPAHVLVGCIGMCLNVLMPCFLSTFATLNTSFSSLHDDCVGGIGIFIAKTGLEVTANISFSLDMNGWSAFLQNFHLLVVVFGFEAGLRLINHWTKDESGQSRYPLLSPIYFILITPIFYLGFWMFSGKGVDDEYFFPPLTECSDNNDCDGGSSSLWGESVWEIFHVIDLSTVSWTAVVKSIPTMIALVMFSLIHVP